MHIGQFQGELATVLSRRIGVMRCISPLVNAEMQYIGRKWQSDLARSWYGVQPQQHASAFPMITPAEALATRGQGPVVNAKGSKTKKRVRPQKCWHCTERHWNRDPVCPMARHEPEKWIQMTRKVRGRRAKRGAKVTFKGKKVVFED